MCHIMVIQVAMGNRGPGAPSVPTRPRDEGVAMRLATDVGSAARRAAGAVEPRRVVGHGVGLAAAAIGGQVVYAAQRRVPGFTDHDASGTFGHAGLPPLRVAAVGDSTMTGPGLDSADELWLRIVARRLAERYHVTLASVARGGARSADVLHDQLDPAIAAGPDVAFVSVGGNDVLHLVPVWRYERRLDAIVARLEAAVPVVILFGIGDLGTIPRAPVPLRYVLRSVGLVGDAVHQRVARRHQIDKVDQWRLTTTAFRAGQHMFAADLFHPSAAGHRAWADAVMPTLDAALAHIAPPRSDGRA